MQKINMGKLVLQTHLSGYVMKSSSIGCVWDSTSWVAACVAAHTTVTAREEDGLDGDADLNILNNKNQNWNNCKAACQSAWCLEGLTSLVYKQASGD
jgi:hypothetical protein